MQYGLSHLSLVALRLTPEEDAGMVSQLLYGDHFTIKASRKHWSKISLNDDQCEGWIKNNQLTEISEEVAQAIDQQPALYTTDFITHVCVADHVLVPVLLGSRLDIAPFLHHQAEELPAPPVQDKAELIPTALLYLNSPYLKGGKSPFGIDNAGLTQMIYKIHGYHLPRTTEAQAKEGEPLSFIEESTPGDLAFFDNSEGIINHVGIILEDNYIIHAHGKVRIDRLDHTGIFNTEERRYSHQLRVIKKII